MNIRDYFEYQRKLAEKEHRKVTIRKVALYVADKWIDFLALVIALIALIRTL